MRRHPNERELVLSWDDDRSGRESAATGHLESCGSCRDESERLRGTLARVSEVYAADFGVPASSFGPGRLRLEAALRDAAAAAPPRWWAGVLDSLPQRPLLRGAGAGAAVVAACVLMFAVMTPTPRPATSALALGALPESSLTPGAVSPLTADELCNGVRPSRLVTESVRQDVLRAYGMEQVSAAAYELDALITPELGGSTDPANLWPQRYHSPIWNARVKDELEALLPRMVCEKQITLAQAQQEIAADWIGAYKRYFKTDSPLHAHLSATTDDEDELVFVADRPATTQVARSGW